MNMSLSSTLSVLGLIAVAVGCASLAHSYSKSDHFDGEHFSNMNGLDVTKGFFSLVKWQLAGGKSSWPEHVENKAKPQIASDVPPGEAHISFVNHATELIQLHGLNVLTDPLYSERASPFGWIGPKRVRAPGVAARELPKIDLVVVSHSHYDHMDVATLKALHDNFHPTFVVPLGNKHILIKHGVAADRITELDWWQKKELGEKANERRSVTLVPAQHWSARGVLDRNEALWGGYIIEAGGVRVFFAGDTGYGPHFKEIHKREGAIDVALLPIGAYEPRWFMKDQHMNPADAVLAHQDLQSLLSLGMHYGCFQLTNEAIDDPQRELVTALADKGIAEAAFRAPETGETTVFRKAAKK